MTVNAADSPPFDTLEAMKARHKELLRTAEKEETIDTVRARVLEFLSRGTATGLVLDNPGDRRVAQGLIDYWKATLYTQLRGEVEPSAPCPTETVLKEFPEDDSVKLATAAEGAVAVLTPEDRDVARQILQRLVRLEPAVREFHPVAAPRAALDELGNVGQVVRVVHALESAGVIRSVPAPGGDTQIELAAAHLVRTWPRYADWLKDRLAFRTAAYLWQQHERHSSGLLAGRLLGAVAGYRDLDAVESEFMLASQASTERARKVQLWTGIGTLVVAIAVLSVIAALQSARAESERQRALDAEGALAARDAFDRAEKGWKEERDLLDRTRRDDLEVKKLLVQRQKIERVFNINRMIRALSDIVAASGEYEQLALWRWEELEKELRRDPYFVKLLDDHKRQLTELTGRNSQVNRGPIVMAIAREIRNDSLKKNDQEVIAMLKSMRGESYRTVSRLAQKLDEGAREKKSFAEVRPYHREFLRYYWGALAMVESRPVELAMVEFKYALDAWERWDRDKAGKWDTVRDRLAAARKNLESKLEEDLKQDVRPSAPGAPTRK